MSKPDRLKARLPRGFVDRGPAELAATGRMLDAIRRVYESYGFEALETPLVEYTDALGKFLPDQDRPNEGVFSFQDDDEQWLSLRYDLTAPLARHVAENFDALPKPYRSYRAGWVFRNEKPGPGRFRQFMQFDADTVGAGSVAADAEICMMAADTLEAVGIKRGDYVIKVNNRKVLDGVMEAIGLGGDENAGRRLTVLRALDKYDRLGSTGVRQLLGRGRTDESGDHTLGAGLTDDQANKLLMYVTAGTPLDTVQIDLLDISTDNDFIEHEVDGEKYAAVFESDRTIDFLRNLFDHEGYQSGLSELETIAGLSKACGYGTRRIRIDPSVVRGLEYYTGPVYEAELTFQVPNEQGQPVRYGSVGGGGRYDGLVGRFRGEVVPATGFSIGVSRLFAALQAIKSPIVTGAKPRPLVVVTAMDQDQVARYQRLLAELRSLKDEAGEPLLRAEMYLGAGKFGAQMKYADRRGAVCAIIQGSSERDAEGGPQVIVKDLIEGAAAAAAIKTNAEWKAARPAQFAVPEAEMAAKVREVLARHA
ncbi:MAG TPA: histidine--tRNA ligase [Beijerinckiaceae bacterium]|jgi:histidyl-tRNA synthetase